MSIEEKVPMSRTSITIVVVILLCAAGFAYSQGWFNWSTSSYETGSNEVGTAAAGIGHCRKWNPDAGAVSEGIRAHFRADQKGGSAVG